MLALASMVLVAIYLLAVQTAPGQALENAALRGADQVSADDEAQAWNSLGMITVWSLAIATATVGIIGVLRRKYLLAVVAVGTIVAGQVITQSLKRFILPRPELVPVVGDFTGNSFPSGHTTIAMTVFVAVLLVVPFRFRGLAMFVVMSWAVAIGAYTVTAKWHRFSDTLGADMVALIVGALAALVLFRAGLIERVDSRPRLRVIYVVAMALSGFVALALGTFIAAFTVGSDLRDSVIEWDAYLAANSLTFGCSVLAGLMYWGSWRRLQVR
ncbi:phosphatase PAP2 family protein [Leucobacter sp. cx-87]|nr:phosphatase PAP2 family protein [Leucobacter sp. cx-87]